jgi:phosphoglycerol transferase MdoB-like AlkP superfamily enzyme
VILVESFGSEFWGSLGRPGPSLTPRMDALAKEGTLFTHVYACGNRTVRGMEGVLASFPPLPGDSIVKRDRSENVATLARTLGGQGYGTVFLYGGRGTFDGLRSFMLPNGYERFIEQKDFEHPVFTTIWGVSDEDLVRRAVTEFDALAGQPKPFLGTLLTVSNHKPFTYPDGRIPEASAAHARYNAVKYTDYALGLFFDLAKTKPWYKDTLFAVVADHGARVYGKQTIPIHSYEIPVLIVDPQKPQGRRLDMLGSSLDVGPTLLGLLGLSYPSTFFGRDLLRPETQEHWVVMHHNRDVGFLRGKRMVVMGIQKTIEFYDMDWQKRELTRADAKEPQDDELLRDATAVFQVADDLYRNRRYRVDAPPAR